MPIQIIFAGILHPPEEPAHEVIKFYYMILQEGKDL